MKPLTELNIIASLLRRWRPTWRNWPPPWTAAMELSLAPDASLRQEWLREDSYMTFTELGEWRGWRIIRKDMVYYY